MPRPACCSTRTRPIAELPSSGITRFRCDIGSAQPSVSLSVLFDFRTTVDALMTQLAQDTLRSLANHRSAA
ncbi:hypothetical protein RSSM_02086 [Rhodopirellula sallentina SM41]|uniref:Uncharacterized protein n=1 Tax=Rhodopirellula sallentina SM41 TaxID=1263870 RepID=M5U4X0_9BACT|nr:hypothetical protein RSSM_02086 [Rhodopirellula sallentina SM41]